MKFLKAGAAGIVGSAFFFLTLTATAEELRLNDKQITLWLSDATAISTDANAPSRQYFFARGRTYYWDSNKMQSIGLWRVENGQYCSQWPPNPNWACYDVTGAEIGGRRNLTFISKDKSRTYPNKMVQGFHPPK